MISHTRQGYGLSRALGSASGLSHARARGYDLLQALASAASDVTHDTGGTICYGHWVLHFVIS